MALLGAAAVALSLPLYPSLARIMCKCHFKLRINLWPYQRFRETRLDLWGSVPATVPVYLCICFAGHRANLPNVFRNAK